MDTCTPRTVIIADDHSIVRQGVAQVLESLDNVSVVAEADNGLSAIASVKKHKPTLLVLDSGMPLARGIEVFLEARRWSPDTRTILVYLSQSIVTVVRCGCRRHFVKKLHGGGNAGGVQHYSRWRTLHCQ